jgi:uncharacterized protein (TIGR00725 family)
MKYKIAVFGSARKDLPQGIYKLARKTGEEIAKRGHLLITGSAEGVSRSAAEGAKLKGGATIGISPTKDIFEKENFNISFDFIDNIIHTGAGYKGRNIISVKSSDGIIIINGGFGTLNEVTIAEGEVKPIVVLKDSGGCANLLKNIFSKLNPKYPYFSLANSPKDAVDKILKLIKKSK